MITNILIKTDRGKHYVVIPIAGKLIKIECKTRVEAEFLLPRLMDVRSISIEKI
jgi:hypothetical protein